MKDSKNIIRQKLDLYQIQITQWLRRYDHISAGIIFVAVTLLIAFISLPDSFTLNLPTDDHDVGKVMKFSIRADRDYIITDEEATKNLRIQAEQETPKLYNVIDNTVYYEKVRGAFSMMRNFVESFVKDYIKRKDKKHIAEPFKELYQDAVLTALKDGKYKNLSYELEKALENNKSIFDKEIGPPIDNLLFQILSENYFDEKLEKIIFSLIDYLDNFYIYRSGIGGYKLDHIVIRKGDALLKVPLNRVVTENTLLYEIDYGIRKLGFDKQLSIKGKSFIAAFVYWIVRDNVNYSSDATEKKKQEAWNSVNDVVFSVKNGEIIRRAGEIITEKDIRIFREIVKEARHKSIFILYLEYVLYLSVVILALFFAFSRSVSKFSYRNKDLLLMSFQALLAFIIWDLIVSLSIPFSQWMGNIDARIFYFILPMPFVVATIRLLVNTETAIFFMLVLSLSLLTIFPDSYYFPTFYTIGSIVYLFLVTHIEKRSNILKVSFFLAIILMLMTGIIFMLDFTLPGENFFRALFVTFLGAMFSGFLIMGVIPIYEWLLGYTTDITFLEFSSLNHPLMKRMAVYANGTYQHSLTVGSIVESAARDIGLSPLACKVMAYFHDIGKIERPEYFSENQTGKNKHDELAPSMSAMIIINHVKRGLELARQHNLGEKIEQAISQHQGTSLIKYFYAKAKTDQDSVQEDMFRYPGPRPQSREVGLIMLADSVEAAVRSMPEKNYQKIQDAVHNIITKIVNDGQLSECNMTMRDIALIEKSFVKTLSGIYHARIEYPDPVA